MKKLPRGIAILLLTFLVGLSSTYIFDRLYVRFEEVAVGSIVLPPDGRGRRSFYKASDGVNLSFDHLAFTSAAAARAAYEQVLSRSRKIIEREPLYNREGKLLVGERVVVIFSSEDGSDCPLLICLDGQTLYEISSTSLRHILLFDKTHRLY